MNPSTQAKAGLGRVSKYSTQNGLSGNTQTGAWRSGVQREIEIFGQLHGGEGAASKIASADLQRPGLVTLPAYFILRSDGRAIPFASPC